jgi:catechol 2,3-dioxygenase-like lactoylglutathione lyase family enzyme
MFEHTKAYSGFAVDDVPRAKQFYGETLGLRVSEENGLLFLHIAGNRDTLVYPKPGHTPASFTILNFPVDDIKATVDALTERGVRFERYAGTEMETDEKGIFRGGGPLIAWFTDPAGNVLSVIQDG